MKLEPKTNPEQRVFHTVALPFIWKSILMWKKNYGVAMFVQVSKEDHFEAALEDNVINPYAWWEATCMLGEDNWTSKNTKGWSVSKCGTQFYPFIALRSFFTWTWCWRLYWIGSSQEHDLDTRLHTSWRFTPFIGQGIPIEKAPQHFQTSINRCKFTRASEVCFCEFI